MAGVPPEEDPTEPPSEAAATLLRVPDATKPGAAKSVVKTSAAVDEIKIKNKIHAISSGGRPGNA